MIVLSMAGWLLLGTGFGVDRGESNWDTLQMQTQTGSLRRGKQTWEMAQREFYFYVLR
jgi:hypothetical protein